ARSVSLQRRVSEPSVHRAGEAIQDQLNSNGIPRFLDFFSRGTGSSNPSPSSGESLANLTSSIRAPNSATGSLITEPRGPSRCHVAAAIAGAATDMFVLPPPRHTPTLPLDP